MPKEVRYILFSPEEVMEALTEGLVHADPGWRSLTGPVRLDLATAPSGTAAARLVARRPRPGQRAAWSFDAGEILTLLLQSCRRHRIPLPLRGLKRIETMGTCICLTVLLGDVELEPEVTHQEIRYLDPDLAPLLTRRA